MNRIAPTVIVLTMFLGFVYRAAACSDVACVGNGTEMRDSFVVTIQHADRPLLGAKVEITSGVNGAYAQRFSGTTDQHGKVYIAGLPKGEYWLKASLLGIDAAYQCFHVAKSPTRKAKRDLKFDWGDWAPSTRQIAGKLVYCEPAKDKGPVLSFLCTSVPVMGTKFTLQHPVTGATYAATSDEKRSFTFKDVPSGTYVLHAEGGRTPDRAYDSTDVLINLNPDARNDALLLTKREPCGGSCGGTSLDLETSVTP